MRPHTNTRLAYLYPRAGLDRRDHPTQRGLPGCHQLTSLPAYQLTKGNSTLYLDYCCCCRCHDTTVYPGRAGRPGAGGTPGPRGECSPTSHARPLDHLHALMARTACRRRRVDLGYRSIDNRSCWGSRGMSWVQSNTLTPHPPPHSGRPSVARGLHGRRRRCVVINLHRLDLDRLGVAKGAKAYVDVVVVVDATI